LLLASKELLFSPTNLEDANVLLTLGINVVIQCIVEKALMICVFSFDANWSQKKKEIERNCISTKVNLLAKPV
jgi:hypothetical protein